MPGSRSAEDEALVQEFLDQWDGISGPKIAFEVPGISQKDVSRWRRGNWVFLSSEKKSALRKAARLDSPSEERREMLIAAKWMEKVARQLRETASSLVSTDADEKGDRRLEVAEEEAGYATGASLTSPTEDGAQEKAEPLRAERVLADTEEATVAKKKVSGVKRSRQKEEAG